jgi:uncharacterized damage-inducible protein DinB
MREVLDPLVVIHGTRHRGQVATMPARPGSAPALTDSIGACRTVAGPRR